MEEFKFSEGHQEESKQSITAMPELSIRALDEEMELDRIDYKTMLEEIRVS